jgi:hypothetical protein
MSPSGARQLARCPGDQNPVVRGALGKSKLARAEREHGREGAIEVELALIDLAEVQKQLRLDGAGPPGKLAGGSDQFFVAH